MKEKNFLEQQFWTIFHDGSSFFTKRFAHYSTHPDIKGGDDLLGFTSTLKSTTTASPEEGSGNTADSEDDNYWNVVYEAIVWIDAFTVRCHP